MTATETLTPPTQSSHPPTPSPAARPRRRLLLAAALVVLAVVALAIWLLTTSSQTQTRPVSQTVAGAPQQQPQLPPWAPGDVNAVDNLGSLDSSAAGYAQFCQSSPVLCSPAAAQAPNAGYVQFCLNSPTLCTVAKPN